MLSEYSEGHWQKFLIKKKSISSRCYFWRWAAGTTLCVKSLFHMCVVWGSVRCYRLNISFSVKIVLLGCSTLTSHYVHITFLFICLFGCFFSFHLFLMMQKFLGLIYLKGRSRHLVFFCDSKAPSVGHITKHCCFFHERVPSSWKMFQISF